MRRLGTAGRSLLIATGRPVKTPPLPIPRRSSAEDGRGQTGRPGLLREADGAGASAAELHEGDAAVPPAPPAPPPSPPDHSQRAADSHAQLGELLQPHTQPDSSR